MGEAKRRKSAGGAPLRRLVAPPSLPAIGTLVVPAGIGLPDAAAAAQALATAETIRGRVRASLAAASAAGTVAAMLEAVEAVCAAAAYEDEARGLLAAQEVQRAEMDRVECRRGGTFCCHLRVKVTPLEAVRLFGAMRRGAIPDRSAAVLRRDRTVGRSVAGSAAGRQPHLAAAALHRLSDRRVGGAQGSRTGGASRRSRNRARGSARR